MREKFIRICQNGPLDKFMRFLFMCSSALCIVMYMHGVIKIYVGMDLCDVDILLPACNYCVIVSPCTMYIVHVVCTCCRIPLWEGCLITGVDTFTFLFLESYGKAQS